MASQSSSSATDCKADVYKFMATTNRPFSSNDVVLNLQGMGKSAVDRALEQLTKENKIVMKLNGKQKIYCVVQPDWTAADQQEIQSVDEELLKTDEALREVERKYKQSEAELKTVRGTCSVEEAARKVAETEKSVSELSRQLAERKEASGASTVISAKDMELVKKDYEKYTKEYKRRKRMCTDMLDAILENCLKTKKALYEEIGIETDASAGMPAL